MDDHADDMYTTPAEQAAIEAAYAKLNKTATVLRLETDHSVRVEIIVKQAS